MFCSQVYQRAGWLHMSFGEPRGSEVRTADSLSTEQRRLINSIFLSAALVAARTYAALAAVSPVFLDNVHQRFSGVLSWNIT